MKGQLPVQFEIPSGWTGVGALEERFSKLDKDGAIIVYCGSGVSACPNVIALEEAGYTNVFRKLERLD